MFDDGTYRRTATLPNLGDADNLRYDAAAGQLYLGYGEGALGVIEPSSLKLVASIPVGGHPESFRLEEMRPTAALCWTSPRRCSPSSAAVVGADDLDAELDVAGDLGPLL